MGIGQKYIRGFTIVELLIVIVIIGILATVTAIVYSGIQANARDTSVLSDLDTMDGLQTSYGLKNNVAGKEWYSGSGIDSDLNFTPSEGNVIDVVVNSTDYCIRGYNPRSATYKSLATAAIRESVKGVCDSIEPSQGAIDDTPPISDGSFIQTITNDNCPVTRTRAVDARDNHTYWVQKLPDGNCWMLTNLAYGGGGTNTYNDTKTLTNGTGGSGDLTVATYYVPTSGSNVTIEPTAPSTSTDGNGQYGYLYNWCGAMGGQATAACAAAATPTPNAVSVCPYGWRLPTGNGGELGALNAAINGGSSSDDSGLRNTWLAQRSGYWASGFVVQGAWGFYWSSINGSALGAFSMFFSATNVNTYYSGNKDNGYAVRCIAGN